MPWTLVLPRLLRRGVEAELEDAVRREATVAVAAVAVDAARSAAVVRHVVRSAVVVAMVAVLLPVERTAQPIARQPLCVP